MMLLPLLLAVAGLPVTVLCQCRFNKEYHGDWFSLEEGRGTDTTITANKWNDLTCEQKLEHPKAKPSEGSNTTFLLRSWHQDKECYYCYYVLWRTKNVLQVKKGPCISPSSVAADNYRTSIGYLCGSKLPATEEVTDMFSKWPSTNNCHYTLRGIYNFTYERSWGGGGICNSADNTIRACQDPGSPYIDNQVFYMTTGSCEDNYPAVACFNDSRTWNGTQRYTKSYRPCARWEDNGHFNDDDFPDNTVADAENFCRDPRGYRGEPWCFTKDPSVVEESCGLERCHETVTRTRYLCLGIWKAMLHGQEYTFAAVADTVASVQAEKYKCLLTQNEPAELEERWCMSRFADCSTLNSLYDCDTRLVLNKTVVTDDFCYDYDEKPV